MDCKNKDKGLLPSPPKSLVLMPTPRRSQSQFFKACTPHSAAEAVATIEDLKATEVRLMESLNSTRSLLLRAEIPKLVESIVSEQVKSVRDSQEKEIASIKTSMLEVQKTADLLSPTVQNDDKDAQDMLKMLHEWRVACKEDEQVHLEKAQSTISKDLEKIEDLVGAWVHTWRNRSQRFPRLGHRRQNAAMDAATRNLVLEVPSGDGVSFGPAETLADELDEEHKLIEVYAWVESVWDIAMLIGANDHVGQAIYNSLLVFINICSQILLCLIINDTFTTPMITETLLDDLKNWRTSIAHDVEWLDALTDQTLVGRICEGHTIMSLSSSVADVFQMTLEYTGSKDLTVRYGEDPILKQWWFFDEHYVGITLSVMSCGIWWMIISQDIMHILDLLDGVRSLPSGRTKIRKYGHNRSLSSLSWIRRMSIYMLLLARVLVCGCMLITGTMFMLYTVSLTDLLLNAAALSIILELDNLIFVAFAPGQARALISSMLPLPRAPDRKCLGVSLRYPIVLFTMIGSAIALTFTILVPQADKIEQVQYEICGGNVGFVSAMASNGAVVAAPNNLKKFYEEASTTYRFQAMRQLIENGPSIPGGMSTPTNNPLLGDLSGISVGVKGPSYSLKSIAMMPVDTVSAYWNTDCSDAPGLDQCSGNPRQGCWQMFVLHNITGDTSITSCGDVQMYCAADSLAGVRSRQYCAQTCHCDDPFSDNLFPEMSMGCPRACLQSTKRELALENTPCNDQGNTWKFQNYLRALDHALSYYPPGQRSFALPVQQALSQGGCSAASQPIDSFGYKVDLCADFNFFHWKSLVLICPVSCGCSNQPQHNNIAGCPKSCFR